MPHFGLGFSDGTLEQLRDIVADAAKNSKDSVTERSWLVSQVNVLAGMHAQPWRELEGAGRWQAGSTAPPESKPIFISMADLRDSHLEPGGDGYDLYLGDKTVARLEHACSITAARNRAVGMSTQQMWATANEWLLQNLVERIAQARAQMDVREILDEQKAEEATERAGPVPGPVGSA